ncbi:MAG: chemotaxis protein CheX [Velocimicrobium sp.]
MDKIEDTRLDIDNIFNRVFIDLTMQMLSVKMQKQEEFVALSSAVYCFEIRTDGAFVSQIIFEMDEKVFERIASILYKNYRLTSQESKMYVIEYLNIICGRILSEINNALGKRSRLSIPLRIECSKVNQSLENQANLSYICLDGSLNIIVYFEIQG